MVRQFLGIYASFTEDPIRESVRNAYYKEEVAGTPEIWGIVLNEIDRTQDSRGVMDQALYLLQQSHASADAAAE